MTAVRNGFSILLSMLATAAGPGASADTPARGLDALRWDSRVLLIRPDEGDVEGRGPRRALTARTLDLAERDLLAFVLPEAVDARTGIRLGGGESLARRFGLDQGEGALRAVLIGKDGGAKLRQGGELDLDEIFVTIDGMPMRQSEMRRRETQAR